MKVAMCLALSRFSFDGMITRDDFQEAIEKVINLVYASQKTAEATGLDPSAQQTKKVINFLLSAVNNELPRQQLLILGYGDFDILALDKAIDTLLEMKWIKREKIGIGANSDWLIKLAGAPLESYKRFKEAREKK
jgi:hypothetical protein